MPRPWWRQHDRHHGAIAVLPLSRRHRVGAYENIRHMRSTLASGTPVELSIDGAHDRDLGLVIAPDIFGLRPLYDDLVARLARDWHMPVAAVEPFPGRDLGPEVEGRFAAVPELDDDRVISDLEAAADRLETDTAVLIGFCMGGMYCFKAASSDRFARIGSFYGMIRLPQTWRGPGHREPLDLLASGHPDRVLAIIGDRDPYTPAGDVAALGEHGVHVVRYPEAEHAFAHDPSRPAHRADDAADAFARVRAWVADDLRHGG
jgi:dienelactone hydrolase